MFLWQIRKSYEFLNSWFMQQSLLRLQNKNEKVNNTNVRGTTNNQPSDALTLYADPNNLESYTNNRNNNYISNEGSVNHMYDNSHLNNSRIDYNNSNGNYTFPAGSTNNLPIVQEVV